MPHPPELFAPMRADPPPPARSPRVPCTAMRRTFGIGEYVRSPSGVYFYQVDIEVRVLHGMEMSESDSGTHDRAQDEPRSCSASAMLDAEEVQYYSVRRRYSQFLDLYENIQLALLAAETPSTSSDHSRAIAMPPFPPKESFLPSVLGLLLRFETPAHMLEERRAMFEALLRWIEQHPIARTCAAYTRFLGQPPQSSAGYVSLRQYSSQNWLSTLVQVTKQKQKRRRRLSSDCGSFSAVDMLVRRSSKKRRPLDVLDYNANVASETKRVRALQEENSTKTTPCMRPKKHARASDEEDAENAKPTENRHDATDPTTTTASAQVEGICMHANSKKRKIAS